MPPLLRFGTLCRNRFTVSCIEQASFRLTANGYETVCAFSVCKQAWWWWSETHIADRQGSLFWHICALTATRGVKAIKSHRSWIRVSPMHPWPHRTLLLLHAQCSSSSTPAVSYVPSTIGSNEEQQQSVAVKTCLLSTLPRTLRTKPWDSLWTSICE